MPEFKRSRRWADWKGTATDVAALARLAFDLINDVCGNAKASIQVEEPDVDNEYTSPDSFPSEVTPEQLHRTRRITITAADDRSTERHVYVYLSMDHTPPGVYLSVSGNDRTSVDGINSQMQEAVARGVRRTKWAAVVGPPVAILAAIATLIGPTLTVDHKVLGRVVSGIAVAGWLSIGGWFLLRHTILRVLEVVPEGEQTSWERWQRKVIAAALTLGGLIVVGIVQAATGSIFS